MKRPGVTDRKCWCESPIWFRGNAPALWCIVCIGWKGESSNAGRFARVNKRGRLDEKTGLR